MDIDEFINEIPKMELHAHLNGCLTEEALLKLSELMHKTDSLSYKETCKDIKATSVTLSQCFEKFRIAHALTSTKECLFKATIFVIQDFAKDNVIYLELRTTPKKTDKMTKYQYLQCVLEAIKEASSTIPQIMVKLIVSIDRAEGVQGGEESLSCIKKLREEFPFFIVGVDLSGNPHIGKFSDYTNILEKCREEGLKLALHCGEVLNEKEIAEMLEFGMDRLGHGTFISGDNLDMLRAKGIPVECCLSSNIICQTVSSHEDHHFKQLFNLGHPVMICTDDTGVFDTTLSKELQLACKTYNLKKMDLLTLLTTAVNASFAEPHMKVILLEKIVKYFDID